MQKNIGSFERDVLIYTLGKGLIGLGAFAMIPLVSRSLGAEVYGVLGLLLSLSMVTFQFGTEWIQQGILRYHSKFSENNQKNYKRAVLWISTLTSLICTSLVFLLLTLIVDVSLSTTLWVVLYTVLWIWFIVTNAQMRSSFKSVTAISADAIRVLIPVLIVGYASLLAFEFSLDFVIIAMSVGLFTSLVWLIVNNIRMNSLKSDGSENVDSINSRFISQKFWEFGKYMSIWAGCTMAMLFLGRYALELSGYQTILGVYTAFQEVAIKSATLVLMPIVIAFHPRLMHAWNAERPDTVRLLFNRAVTYISILIIIYIVGSIVVYPVIQSLLFTAQTYEMLTVNIKVLFLVLIVAEAFGIAGLISHKGLEMQNKTKPMAILQAGLLLLYAILLWILTPIAGVFGVVYSLLIVRLLYVVITGSYSYFSLRNYLKS